MIVEPIKTHKITKTDTSLENIVGTYVKDMDDKSILVITSKIVAICEGNIIPEDKIDRDELVKKHADKYMPRELNQYGFMLTITNSKLVASAGIDHSNSDGHHILWPKNAQKTANRIREFIVAKYGKKHLGVLITDSHTVPMTWGVVGFSLAYSGFAPTRNYIGKPDLFGRELQVTHQSNIEGLAGAADVVMGGADEAQPMALISDIPFVEFQGRNPTQEELDEIKIGPEEDVYWPVLGNGPWEKGDRKK